MKTKHLRCAVIGSGAWATVIADLIARKGYKVNLWGKDKTLLRSIGATQKNEKYLKGFHLSRNIVPVAGLAHCVEDVDIVVFGIPVPYLRNVAKKASKHLRKDCVLVNLSKGIENESFCRPSEILQQEIQKSKLVATLAGPNIAKEVISGEPSRAVIAAMGTQYLPWLSEFFSTSSFTVESNDDIVGVELAGALKNVVAVLAGISDGLGFGVNAKSIMLTKSLQEMVELGIHYGAKPSTFLGISGVGDLVASSTSLDGRNRKFGELIARGRTVRGALAELYGRIPEGLETSKAVFRLSKEIGISLPMLCLSHSIIHIPKRKIRSLFVRTLSERFIGAIR